MQDYMYKLLIGQGINIQKYQEFINSTTKITN